jgi:sugar/nucleoside kinase (ribokinase family)
MFRMRHDVFGMENPVMDILAQVPDAFLAQGKIAKNQWTMIDAEQHAAQMRALAGIPVAYETGGSCANTIVGIAQLGAKTAYCGMVGPDEPGRIYAAKLREAGVTPFLRASTVATGSAIIYVTPDAARTMNLFLGACRDLGPQDVPVEEIQQSRWLYITGYAWDSDEQKAAVTLALHTAKTAGVPVAFSLADPFFVSKNREDYLRLVRDYAELVFANRDEALAITGRDHAQEALRDLRKLCPEVALTLGHAGALIALHGETAYVEAFPVTPVDTTGAGDAFAAGFLYGRVTGASPLQCGRLGTYFASRVITQIGPRLSGDVRAQMAPVLNDVRE